tara:strand:+ start:1235 stop:1873 length:639 start_codon:yes stop_codon:yes gene_type:complete
MRAIYLVIFILAFMFGGKALACPMAESGNDPKIMCVGDYAPDFVLPNAYNEPRKLSKLLEHGPVVLSFYRGGWCPICNEQLYEYQQNLDKFKKYNASLVAVSPEKPENANDTAVRNSLKFEVLSDYGNNIARMYDLIWVIPEEDHEGFNEWIKSETNKSLAEFNGLESYELPIPATFVIGRDGKIAYMFRDEDYKNRAPLEEIFKALEGLEE